MEHTFAINSTAPGFVLANTKHHVQRTMHSNDLFMEIEKDLNVNITGGLRKEYLYVLYTLNNREWTVYVAQKYIHS